MGTEHLLLALTRLGECAAVRLLVRLAVEPSRICTDIETIVVAGRERRLPEEVPFTPRARRVLDHAEGECGQMGTSSVGSEHLLLGLLADEDSIATRVLENVGLRLEAVRDAVRRPPPNSDTVRSFRAPACGADADRSSEPAPRPGRLFCRLCGHALACSFDLGMGIDAPPETYLCPQCGRRALDEYTLLLNLGVILDTHRLCACGAAASLWPRGSRFCFRCGRAIADG